MTVMTREVEEKEIDFCDHCHSMKKQPGVEVTYPSGNWFKFCNVCRRTHGISWMVKLLVGGTKQ